MLYSYCPEMGEKEPLVNIEKQVGHLKVITRAPIEINARLAHYGGWFVTTKLELKGRGIRKSGDDSYHLTEKAFEKLEAEYDIKMIEYLD